MTVNAAVAVHSIVEVRPYRARAVRLYSADLRAALTAETSHGFPPDGKLGLLSRGLRHFPPVSGVEILAHNEAPVGSGIGASSALLVALMLAAGHLTGSPCRWEGTSRAAMEIEAAHLRSLTGRQDHLAALRGGIQGIRFLPGRVEVERLPARGTAGAMLRSFGFLAYTGIAHRSSDVNWRMIRAMIDGSAEAKRKFRGIAAAARDAWDALSAADPGATGAAVAAEWAIRRGLAPGVSAPKVESLLADRRFRRATTGAKLCGAGGGGMLFGLLREPGDLPGMKSLLSEAGMGFVPFRPCGRARVLGEPK
jgi:D-glycero-alpha-D-manno-heptose-7-phosphate kinase